MDVLIFHPALVVPDFKFSLEKTEAPLHTIHQQFIYYVGTVILLRALWFTQNLQLPSFFFISIIGLEYGPVLGSYDSLFEHTPSTYDYK